MPVALPATGGADDCPVFQASAAEFRGGLAAYVAAVEAQHSNIGMFVVRPPAGWAPCSLTQAETDAMLIEKPIRQNAFGGRGVYRQVHVEQRSMTVRQFREQAGSERNRPPEKPEEELARQFWRGVELNPPLYGADLPMSLFDDALATGWNLRRLGCLLHTAGLPAIPGVTTPMVYVGCWRSNFAWHTEDADLYSVNFLHAGAPKSWYCVPPSARARFEAMAAGYFPELARACPAFLRHKDITLSPSVLRQHGIPFTCALQRAGEFVINTAGAYHSGFNHGFNLAEATNFATPAWPPLGRAARRCVCCPDAVTIDMRLFAGGAEAHAARAQAQAQARAAEAPAAAPQPAVGDVVAVVGQDAARRRYLYLAQVLGAGAPGCVRLDWLQRSSEDGLYRVAPGPGQAWEEEAASLISALCYERVPGAAGQPDAVRLRTSTASLLRARLVPDEPPAKRPRET